MASNQKKYTQFEIDSITQGKRYVFYGELRREKSDKYKELYRQAEGMIGQYKTQFGSTNGQMGNGLKEAIAFLKDSAEFERQKELQFFKNFETSHPEIKSTFNISVQDILNDYEGFITNLNRAIKGTTQLKKEINMELERIQKNRDAVDNYYDKKKLGKNMEKDAHDAYIKDLQKDLAISKAKNNSIFYMKANGETAFQSLFKQNGHMHTLTQLIIEKFGSKLFDKNLNLNAHETSALIAAVTMKANELFMSNLKLPSMQSAMQKTAQNTINDIEMENFINSLLKSNDLKGTMQSIMDQYDISYKTSKNINDIATKIDRIKQSLYTNFKQLKIEEKKGIKFDDWLNTIGMTEDKIKKMIEASELISAQCYYVGEDLSMMDLVSNHIRAVLGGNKNPTDDIQAGALITNFNFDSNKLDVLEQKLWEKQRSTFLDEVDKTTTYESYKNNIKALKNAREEQVKLIDEFKKENEKNSQTLDDLLSHINIHSTVKGYESAGSALFENNGGFGGAAFGSTLQDELNIINDMVQAGGIDMQFDVENMFIAMINCGKLMIGSTLKPTLVNYLSAFMGMLMFNDASLFAEDVKNWLNNEKMLVGSVQDLHLYQLNGIVVPSSYILQKTYDAMSKLERFDNNYKGVQAVFTTYDKEYIRGQWEKTSAIAIENTKLERMHFLAGFFDLLESIQLRLNNIS